MVGNRKWTEAEKAHIQTFYSAIKNEKLGELVRERSQGAIRHQASRMGIKKSPERLSELARENFGIVKNPTIRG